MANDIVKHHNMPSAESVGVTDFSTLGRMCVESGKKRYDKINQSSNRFDKTLDFYAYYRGQNDDDTTMSCVIGLAQYEDTHRSAVHLAFSLIRDNYDYLKETIIEQFNQLEKDHLHDKEKYRLQRLADRNNKTKIVEVFPDDDD